MFDAVIQFATLKTRIVVGAISAFISYLWTDIGLALVLIGSLVAIDVITGLIKTKYNQEPIVSRRFEKRALQFGGQVCTITSSSILAYHYPQFSFFTGSIILYYCIMEVVSIKENAKAVGLGFPKPIEDKLNSLLNLNK